MKDPEEQWLDYSISFTAEYTYTHALFKGRASLSLLYWMLEISVPKLQITSLTSKKFPKQIALFKENRQALQMQGICSCACPGASTMVLDCWIIISQLPMRRFSEVWCRHQLRGPSFNRAFILCRLCKSHEKSILWISKVAQELLGLRRAMSLLESVWKLNGSSPLRSGHGHCWVWLRGVGYQDRQPWMPRVRNYR